MLRFKAFLVEYLTDQQRERYKDIRVNDASRKATDHFFGKDVDVVHGEIRKDDKSEIHKQIENHLGVLVTPEEYRSGLIKDKYGRDVKIGRKIKNDNLRIQFDEDPSRRVGSSVHKTKTVRGIEVAGQTNSVPNEQHPKGHSWGKLSCKNVEDGVNKHILPHEIENGTVVHFIHDHNGQEIYRATLQPHHSDDHKHTVYQLDAEYGIKHPSFTQDAHRVAAELSHKIRSNSKVKMYYKDSKVYNDNGKLYVIHPKLSSEQLTDALDSKNSRIKDAVASHPNANATHLTKILKQDENPSNSIAALRHPQITNDHLQLALKSNDQYVRATAAEHKKATPDIITKSLGDNSFVVRRAAISSPNATEHHITTAMSDDDRRVRAQAIRHPNATEHHITKALEDDAWNVRRNALLHPKVNTDHLMKAVMDSDSDVVEAAWVHPKISSKHIDHVFAEDNAPRESLRYAVAHPKATAEHADKFIDQIGTSHYNNVKWLAQNKNLRPSHLETLSNSPEWVIRRYVANHPNTPISLLKKLTNDVDGEVAEIAHNRLRKF